LTRTAHDEQNPGGESGPGAPPWTRRCEKITVLVILSEAKDRRSL